MVFLADVGVKVNRKILLCKKSGGDGEICEIEEPPSRTAAPWGRRRRPRPDSFGKRAGHDWSGENRIPGLLAVGTLDSARSSVVDAGMGV